MRIVKDYPPIWDEIDARFHVGRKPVIFAWGDTIFNPNGARVDASLLAHESVHGRRQGDDIMGWWRRYIDEPRFRLEEEVPAHQAEYEVRLAQAVNRNDRRSAEKLIAKRLAGPLYGGLITPARAREVLRQGHKMLQEVA